MFPFSNLDLTVEAVYQRLLDKLKKDGRIEDTSSQLLAMTENYKRVFYVYGLLKSYDLIPLIYKEDKCEYSSVHYRNLGNILYTGGDLYLAWQNYNLALMYSPLHSQSYSVAVANRSAVLASLKKYKECLEDIKMVFTLQYPSNIREKLLKRKRKCEEALRNADNRELDEQNEHIEEIFTMKTDKDEKYVDASSKLIVKNCPEMGRHVVAREDIQVGEILVQEDPYVKVLLRSQVMLACGHCFSRACNLYPCPYCCMTMYCSRPCVEEAWQDYHSIECPLMAALIKFNFTKLEWLAVRTTIKARKDYSSWENVLRSVEEIESCPNPEDVGCKLTETYDIVYSSRHYNSIHHLATNFEKRDISDIFQKTVSAALLMHFICVADFVETDNLELKRKAKIFTAETLMRHLMTAPTNMHGITALAQDKDANYVSEYNIGSGAYAFLSLINHSCAPNVVRYTRLGTGQITLVALRPIKKGMQLFDNYGFIEKIRTEEHMASKLILQIKPIARCLHCSSSPPGIPPRKAHHAVHPRAHRQAILNQQYKFTCICEACIDDWPLYHDLKPTASLPPSLEDKVYDYLNNNVINALQKADKKRALKIFKPLCDLATALEPYHPCKEGAECQEALKQCIAIFAGALPYFYTRFVDWEVPSPKVKSSEGYPTSSRFYAGTGAYGLLDNI